MTSAAASSRAGTAVWLLTRLAIRHTPLKAHAHLKRQRAEIATVLERAREWLEQGEQGRLGEWGY